MKTNITRILTIALLGGVLTSCSSILDKGPLDAYSENEVWSDPELVQDFIYPSISTACGLLVSGDHRTDNDVIYNETGESAVNKESIDNYYDAGWNIYGNIRKVNQAIEHMDNNTDFVEADRENLKAQAKMCRALIYFSRARLFGKLMMVDHVMDADEEMQLPRTSTIKETYDFILKDLEEAAPHLPLTAKQGMMTRGAALAYIGEVALHGAAYIESGQNEYYAKAKKALEELFALNQYSLDSDYGQLFNDFDYALNSKEIILALWKHEKSTTFSDTWMQWLVPNVSNDKLKSFNSTPLDDGFEGWPSSFPSTDFVADYEVVDPDGTAKEWDQSAYYKNYQAYGGYVSDAIYHNRDARFEQTVVRDSTHYFKSLITTRENGNLNWNTRLGGYWGNTITGYLWRKGVYTTKNLWFSDPTYYHYVIMRLGRAYLNYAEVMLRLGDTKTAIEYVNKTRTVHGHLPALPTILTADEAWKAYKRERRVELVHESDRYYSVLRWGKADGKDVVPELTKTHHAIDISADGKSFEIIPLPFCASENERVFTKKRYLMPVPQGERTENSNLDQNEGW